MARCMWSLMWVVLISGTVMAYSGGTGEPNDPYQIATAEDLIALGSEPNDYDKHFILTADIDLSGYVFDRAVIAPGKLVSRSSFEGTKFRGAFDGQEHVISNLCIQGSAYLGLFGYCDGADISNLGLENVDVNGTKHFVGSLVGYHWNGTITSCYNTGSVRGDGYVGGLVGGIRYCSITSSYSAGSVMGSYLYVGGLTGRNRCGTITSSYSTGSVSGFDSVGGLVGDNWDGTITSCYSTGSVSGDYYLGGLVGCDEYRGSITSSFWDTETSGLSYSDGGVGLPTAEMQDISTFLVAGWDFVDEVANGTANFWQIQDGHYPDLSVFTGTVPVELQGRGTPEEPYLIKDANDLGSIWYRTQAHYRLIESIDLSDITWNTAVIPRFSGSLDGNGHVISNLAIEGGGRLGLLGYCSPGTVVCNLGLENVEINGTDDYVGGLVGYNSHGVIMSCYSIGSVSGGNDVGGLVGANWNGTITSSYCTSLVRGTDDYVGGLVGYNAGAITSSFSSGSVRGGDEVGGFVGFNNGRVMSSYSTGPVSGVYEVGGFVGVNYCSGTITSSYCIGSVSGDSKFGGLVGINRGSIVGACWDMLASDLSFSGGGVGLGTDEMKDPEALGLAGLAQDPNWVLDAHSDYPRLAWEGAPGSLIPAPDISYWMQGAGLADDPYQIETITQLQRLSKAGGLMGQCFILTADLDLAGIEWPQAVLPDFRGCFDGQGHVIFNLLVIGCDYLGLFGYCDSGAAISNLGLENMDINGTGNYVGGLVGYNDGAIASSYSTGLVSGSGWYVGSLVGYNYHGSIISSYSTGFVNGDHWIGGLIGYNDYGNISSSYSTASVSGRYDIGGLVGYHHLGTIALSYSIGSVSGDDRIGGLVGRSWADNVTSSFWDIETSGQSTSAGGTGLTTAQMQDINSFLDAGWDFVDETDNGTDDLWWMPISDYPRLWWEAAE